MRFGRCFLKTTDVLSDAHVHDLQKIRSSHHMRGLEGGIWTSNPTHTTFKKSPAFLKKSYSPTTGGYCPYSKELWLNTFKEWKQLDRDTMCYCDDLTCRTHQINSTCLKVSRAPFHGRFCAESLQIKPDDFSPFSLLLLFIILALANTRLKSYGLKVEGLPLMVSGPSCTSFRRPLLSALRLSRIIFSV